MGVSVPSIAKKPKFGPLTPHRTAAQQGTRTAATSSAAKTPRSTLLRRRKHRKHRKRLMPKPSRPMQALRRAGPAHQHGGRRLLRTVTAGPTLTGSAGTRTSLRTVSQQQGPAFSVEAGMEALRREPAAGTEGRVRALTMSARTRSRNRLPSRRRSCASAGCTLLSGGRAVLDRDSGILAWTEW